MDEVDPDERIAEPEHQLAQKKRIAELERQIAEAKAVAGNGGQPSVGDEQALRYAQNLWEGLRNGKVSVKAAFGFRMFRRAGPVAVDQREVGHWTRIGGLSSSIRSGG